MAATKKRALPKTFTALHHQLCSHPAWLTMSYGHQIILIDMYRQVQRWTSYGSAPLTPEGFPYGYNHCCCLVSRATWKRAIADIELRGFFARNPLARGPGIMPRWTYSHAWRRYKPEAKTRPALLALHHRVTTQERTDSRQMELNLSPLAGSIPPHSLAQIWRLDPRTQAQIEPLLSLSENGDTTKIPRAREIEPQKNRRNGTPESVASILQRAIQPT